MFPDGQKLVTVHDADPARRASRWRASSPGEIVTAEGEIELNAGRDDGDGDRAQHRRPPGAGRLALPLLRGQPRRSRSTARRAFGMRLDIPAGTAVRFEPGDEREVDLVAFGGEREVHGLNGLTDGPDRRRAGARRRWRARASGRLPGTRRAEHGQADLAARVRRAVRADDGRPRPARRHRPVGGGRATTCSCPATSASSAAARRCATASARTARSRRPTARSTS